MSAGIPEFDADNGGAHADDVAGGNRSASPYIRDELAPVADSADGRTMLEQLTDDLAGAEPVEELPPIALQRRPSYVVVFAKITDGNVIDEARKRSKDRSKADGVDGPKFAALICVSSCLRIVRDGTVLADDEGRPLRFNHRMLLQALNAASAADCARKFYGNDAELDAVARKVMTDSGWGADAVEADVADPQRAGSPG